jgi:hypothetical protein
MPGLLPIIVRHRAALLPRFAVTYTALRALPRRVRRALHRTGRASLASVALWLVLGQGPVDAATIVVQGACTLVHAIRAANGGPTRTHALVPGSLALDAIPATDPGCAGMDQRGVPRPQGVGCDIGAVEGGAPTVMNDQVTLVPLPATFQTSANVSGCPPGFVGTFRFTAQLTPQAPSPPLVALVVEVETLSNGNLVQNALGEPQGVGARVPVPLQGGVADGLLSPHEAVEVPLVICLRQKTPFQFFVDVLGVEQE